MLWYCNCFFIHSYCFGGAAQAVIDGFFDERRIICLKIVHESGAQVHTNVAVQEPGEQRCNDEYQEKDQQGKAKRDQND